MVTEAVVTQGVESTSSSSILSHSFSESRIGDSVPRSVYSIKHPHSISTENLNGDDDSSSINSASSLPAKLDDDFDKKEGDNEPDVGDKTPQVVEAQQKERRRFNFSFLDKSSNKSLMNKSGNSGDNSDMKGELISPSTATTPTRSSLRTRVMGFMSKSSSAKDGITVKKGSLLLREMSNSDPFSGEN